MGYIELKEIPEIKKLVLSLWFRIPQESIDACLADKKLTGLPPPFNGVIPLVCLGKKGKLNQTEFNGNSVSYRRVYVATYTNPPPEITSEVIDVEEVSPGHQIITVQTTFNPNFSGFSWTELGVDDPFYLLTHNWNVGTTGLGDDIPQPTSYIGVRVEANGNSFLDILIDTGMKATVAKADYDIVGVTPYIEYSGNSIITGSLTYKQHIDFGIGGDTFDEDDSGLSTVTADTTIQQPHKQYADRSTAVYNGTQQFTLGTDDTKITPDHWHHVILILELKTVKTTAHESGRDVPGEGVISASRAWIALDDVNYVKEKLSFDWPTGYSDNNGVITTDGARIANFTPAVASTNVDGSEGPPAGTATYLLTDPSIPKGKPGFPAKAEFVNNIYNVEMGGFQMFTDVTEDTSKETTRRAFITEEGKPAKLSAAVKLFGKKPEVKLWSRSSWKKAKNQGTLFDPKDPNGDHVGDIKTYKPDPSLHGPQKPGDKK